MKIHDNKITPSATATATALQRRYAILSASVISWITPWNIGRLGVQHHKETRRKWLWFCPPHLILLLHYLVKCKGAVWPFTTVNSYWVVHTGSDKHCGATKALKICYLFNTNQEWFCRIKISNVDELKWRINSKWACLSHTVIECAVGQSVSSASMCLRSSWSLKADILIFKPQCNKDDVIWRVWGFWETLRQ